MADYYSQTVIQPDIPDGAMTPLERLILEQVFESETYGGGVYFFSSDGPNTCPCFTRAALAHALAQSQDCESVLTNVTDDALKAAPPDEDDITLDVNAETWESVLQDIVRRSPKLDYITVETAWTCSKMRADGFGGAAVLITADAVKGKSTHDIIEDFLAEAKKKSFAAAAEFGVDIVVRITAADVRAAVLAIAETDSAENPLRISDVTDDDIRTGCRAIAANIDLREQEGAAVLSAALTALRCAAARIGVTGP
jgi:hypothetical protein